MHKMVPFLLVVFLLTGVLKAEWWMFFAAFWLVPMFFGGMAWCMPWGWHHRRYDRRSSYQNQKRKNDDPLSDFDFDAPTDTRKRRIVRLADGEFMTVVEDPETGVFVVEGNGQRV